MVRCVWKGRTVVCMREQALAETWLSSRLRRSYLGFDHRKVLANLAASREIDVKRLFADLFISEEAEKAFELLRVCS